MNNQSAPIISMRTPIKLIFKQSLADDLRASLGKNTAKFEEGSRIELYLKNLFLYPMLDSLRWSLCQPLESEVHKYAHDE